MKEVSNFQKFDNWLYKHIGPMYNIFCITKSVMQKIFRKSHCSDSDLWRLQVVLAKNILPKLIDYRNQNFDSFPTCFSDWDPLFGVSKEEYFSNPENIGGGLVQWMKTIDEMIFAFEYLAYEEQTDRKGNPTKRRIKMFEKYKIKDPFENGFDKNICYKNHARVSKGLSLFAKHFIDLWD